jgi:hypothetical protein
MNQGREGREGTGREERRGEGTVREEREERGVSVL